jgi:hypothetical protein
MSAKFTAPSMLVSPRRLNETVILTVAWAATAVARDSGRSVGGGLCLRNWRGQGLAQGPGQHDWIASTERLHPRLGEGLS